MSILQVVNNYMNSKKGSHITNSGGKDMPRKTLYVRDEDLALWEKAETLAGEESLSGVVASALKNYIAVKEHQKEGYERVELEVCTIKNNFITGASHTIAFTGRFLYSDDVYDVYLTTKGNLLFYNYAQGTGGFYDTYASLDDARDELDNHGEQMYDADLLAGVAEALGVDYVHELDI